MLWPDEVWPQDIGALAILEGRPLLDRSGGLDIDGVLAVLAARLHRVPRLRQVLYSPPREQGGPLWIDAPAFQLAEHVEVRRVEAPGGEAELKAAVEQLVEVRLDRSRPLWMMWFLTGLPAQRVGWFVRIHHSIADGIAGVAMLGSLLDAIPTKAVAPAKPWTPERAPSEVELLAEEHRRAAADRRRRLATLTHPVAGIRGIAAAWPALRELLAEPALPPTSLTTAVGSHRKLAFARVELGLVKEIAHRGGAKVNDVLLATIAGGVRTLMQQRCEPLVPELRAYVPITLRPADQRATARGNQIAEMMVPLPIAERDPFRRLRRIAQESSKRKARPRSSVGKMPQHGVAGTLFLKLIDRQRVNVTTADLHGPQVPLYLAGARLLEVFPVLPLIGTVSLGVGALSYAGEFNITAVADGDAYRDLDIFVQGLIAELAALALSLGIPSVGATAGIGLGAISASQSRRFRE